MSRQRSNSKEVNKMPGVKFQNLGAILETSKTRGEKMETMEKVKKSAPEIVQRFQLSYLSPTLLAIPGFVLEPLCVTDHRYSTVAPTRYHAVIGT